MGVNLGQITQKLKRELAHGSSVDPDILDWINAALLDVARERIFESLRASSSKQTVATERIVDCDTDAGTVLTVWYQDTSVSTTQPTRELWPSALTDLRRMYREDATGTPAHYRVLTAEVADEDLRQIELWPIPDDAYSIIIDHLRWDIELAEDSDQNFFTRKWPYLVIYRAKWYGANALGDDDLADRADGQYGSVMARAAQSEDPQQRAPIEFMPWSPNVIPDRGWRRE